METSKPAISLPTNMRKRWTLCEKFTFTDLEIYASIRRYSQFFELDHIVEEAVFASTFQSVHYSTPVARCND